MKRKPSPDSKLTAVLCGGFFIVLAVYVFGVGVRVDWHATNVSFPHALSSIQLRTIFHDFLKDDYFSGISFAGLLVIGFTMTSSRRMQFVLVLIGLLFPIICYGLVFAVVMIFSPFIVFEILGGFVNGEFYVESMPEAAAIGLWMLLCVCLSSFQIFQRYTISGKLNN